MGRQSRHATCGLQAQYQKVLILRDERGKSSQLTRPILLFFWINA
jgi:hypothetical protein